MTGQPLRSRAQNVISRTHARTIHSRRVRVLASRLATLLPADGTVLDIGCGDGLLDAELMVSCPARTIRGIETLLRPASHIPVDQFDGKTIPHPAGSFDASMLIDVLHHSDDPETLLAEAVRVSRSAVIVKDHLADAWLANPRLRLMDQVGNRAYGVAIPYNYWSSDRWFSAFGRLGITPRVWDTELHLYPAALDRVFGRSLHFIARLEPA